MLGVGEAKWQIIFKNISACHLTQHPTKNRGQKGILAT
jgi:hypothetical protein